MTETAVAAESWRLHLHQYAEHMSGGAWRPYRHLVHVAKIVQEEIRKGGARIIVTMPPRHGKSSLISKWLPAWYLDWNPDKRVVITSFDHDLAVDFSRWVRDHLTDHPEAWTRISRRKKRSDNWMTSEGGGGLGQSVGGGITGKGGDLVICDDLIKDWEEAHSITTRRKTVDWFLSTLYTRLEPAANLIIPMTRWHVGDPVGYILKNLPDKWIEIRLPAFAEVNDPIGRAPGEPLCPERYDLDALNDRRTTLGSRKFEGLYQQRPTVAGGDILREKWFRFWYEGEEPDPWQVVAPDGTITECMQETLPDRSEWDGSLSSWDLTFKNKATSDYVAGHLWAWRKAKRYLLDREYDQMGFRGALAAILRMHEKWDPDGHLIEDSANGPAVIETLQDEVPGIVPVTPRGSKRGRVEAIAPQVEAGNMYLPHPRMPGYEWVEDVIEAFTRFPSEPDDDADSASQALNWIRRDAKEVEIPFA